MNLVVFSGPPSSGKTSIILKTIDALKDRDISVGVVNLIVFIQMMIFFMKRQVFQLRRDCQEPFVQITSLHLILKK